MGLASNSPLEHENLVERIFKELQDLPGALLPILHRLQDELGFIPPALLPVIATGLNLSRAEVHGVVSFYHYFRSSPPGRNTIQICRAESCQAMGSRALEVHAQRALRCKFNQTSADGEFTLLPVYCLGNCACAPNAMLNGELHGRVDAEGLLELLAEKEMRA